MSFRVAPDVWRDLVDVPVGLLGDGPALEAFLDGRTIEHLELMVWAPDWRGTARGAYVAPRIAHLAGVDNPPTLATLVLAHHPTYHPHHRGGTAKEATHG